jgi:hypothetical protein
MRLGETQGGDHGDPPGKAREAIQLRTYAAAAVGCRYGSLDILVRGTLLKLRSMLISS